MISIGNSPKYVSSEPSTLMKSVEEEIRANKLKDAKNAEEMAKGEDEDAYTDTEGEGEA